MVLCPDLEKYMIGYKALTHYQSRLVSLSAMGKAMVDYQMGKEIYPPEWLGEKGYGLLIFGNLEDAQSFGRKKGVLVADGWLPNSSDAELWEVEYEKEVPLLPPCSMAKLPLGIIEPSSNTFTQGTIAVKSLRLLKQIYWKNG